MTEAAAAGAEAGADAGAGAGAGAGATEPPGAAAGAGAAALGGAEADGGALEPSPKALRKLFIKTVYCVETELRGQVHIDRKSKHRLENAHVKRSTRRAVLGRHCANVELLGLKHISHIHAQRLVARQCLTNLFRVRGDLGDSPRCSDWA